MEVAFRRNHARPLWSGLVRATERNKQKGAQQKNDLKTRQQLFPKPYPRQRAKLAGLTANASGVTGKHIGALLGVLGAESGAAVDKSSQVSIGGLARVCQDFEA